MGAVLDLLAQQFVLTAITKTLAMLVYFEFIHTIEVAFCYVSSLYNLVKNQLGAQFFFSVYLYLSISTCFELLWAHHPEIELCLYGTWCLLFCVDD